MSPKFYLTIFTLLTLGAASPNVQAGVLFEPYLGYEMGSLSYKYTPAIGTAAGLTETYNDKFTGTAYGARLAYAMPFFFFGVDGTLSSGQAKRDPKVEDKKIDSTRTTVYALVGVSFAVVRAWFGYGVYDQLISKNSSGETTFSGDAMKFGLGYKFLPSLSLNVEYEMHKPNSYTIGGTTNPTSNLYEKIEYNPIIVSLSFPLNF